MPAEIGNPVNIPVHPQYQRWWVEWQRAYDFLRGGMHVKSPLHPVTKVSFLGLSKPGDSGASDAESAKPTYSQQTVPSYLFSHVREGWSRYWDRVARAEHIPIMRPIVGIFSSQLFRVPPRRRLNGTDDLGRYADYAHDVDLCGTGIDAFSAGAARWAMAFGRAHAVTDVPRLSRPLMSLAEQQELGVRAYSYLCTPLQVLNWSLDQRGRYNWVTLAEPGPDDRSPVLGANEQQMPSLQWRRVWYRDHWELYKPAGNAASGAHLQWLFDSREDHDLGVVPVSTLFADKSEARNDLEADSPMASILSIDFAVFNLLSQLDETELCSVFNQLVMHEQDMPAGDVDVGEATVLPFTEAPPAFIAPPGETAQGKWDRLVARVNMAARQALSSRGRAEFSKEERSAQALGVEYQDRYAMLANLAGNVEDFEDGVFDHFGRWHGIGGARPKSEYERRFDLRSISQMITDAIAFGQLDGVGVEARAAFAEAFVDRVLKEVGVEDTARRRAVSGVKEAAAEALEATKAAKAAAARQPTTQDPDQVVA